MDLSQLQNSIDYILHPVLITMLLGTGLFLTLRLGFIQFRRFRHGIDVARGKYDDPDHPGEVTHFQALTTALSATVGIGNIAGVAIALHFGGPGAIFWMWVTAVLGMATKFTEVTLAQHFRVLLPSSEGGGVAGGPMYYIEKGLGKNWKPMAMFVAFALMLTAFLSGNAIQANTIADLAQTELGLTPWITGLCTAAIIGLVIIGGIKRIGQVTSVIAPAMALIYVLGGIAVLATNWSAIGPAFSAIFSEAFNPTAGVAGTGVGIFIQTMMWGIRRGLFSNEAGQGSAPIAHSAARTDKPASEGVVALLEPFIDTIVICTITALVIITTGVWKETTPTTIELDTGDIAYVQLEDRRYQKVDVSENLLLHFEDGFLTHSEPANIALAWHDVPVERLFTDQKQVLPFTGTVMPAAQEIRSADGQLRPELFGLAMENGAPLTRLAYVKALGPIGAIVVALCVFLFGISTSISWSYYGDRCAYYLFGRRAILPYQLIFVAFHFLGAVTSLNTIWNLGDTVLAFVTIPNVLALVILSGLTKRLTDQYFSELEN